MDKLTGQQREVLKFAKAYTKKHGMPPTRKEISASFGWKSWNSAQCHLEALKTKGYIDILPGKLSRGIMFLK